MTGPVTGDRPVTDPAVTAPRGRGAGAWPLIHAERAALAADLGDMADERWETPSLCAGLTVREVLAHLTAGASLNTVRWMAGVIRCRFDFDKQVAMRLAEQLGATPGRDPRALPARRPPSTTKPPCPPWPCWARRSCTERTSGVRWASAATTRSRLSPGWHEYYRGSDLVVLAKGASTGCGSSRTTPLHDRLGAARIRPHPVPGDGHDRPRDVLRRTRRRRSGVVPQSLRDGVTSRPEVHVPRPGGTLLQAHACSS